jgi:hypothetical protein
MKVHTAEGAKCMTQSGNGKAAVGRSDFLSNPFVKRLIDTIRRELLDPMLFRNARDLARKLANFRHYHNSHRT